MFSLNNIIRQHILTLAPYSSARDEYTGKEGIFLDANENPFGSVIDGNYNRYPDPHQIDIKDKRRNTHKHPFIEVKKIDSATLGYHKKFGIDNGHHTRNEGPYPERYGIEQALL